MGYFTTRYNLSSKMLLGEPAASVARESSVCTAVCLPGHVWRSMYLVGNYVVKLTCACRTYSGSCRHVVSEIHFFIYW